MNKFIGEYKPGQLHKYVMFNHFLFNSHLNTIAIVLNSNPYHNFTKLKLRLAL